MIQNSIVIEERHRLFIKEICESEQVVILDNGNGCAFAYSNEWTDDNGNPIEVLCFWSDEKRASVCKKEEWSNYQVKKINLAEFLEAWCIGMANDGVLAGTNFDTNLFGFEIEPLELILEIITELKSINKEILLRNYNNLQEFENEVKEVL